MGIDSATLAQRFPTAGQFRVLTPPVKLEGEGFQAQGVPAPFATETRSLLLELGFSSDQIDELISHDVTRERERE